MDSNFHTEMTAAELHYENLYAATQDAIRLAEFCWADEEMKRAASINSEHSV